MYAKGEKERDRERERERGREWGWGGEKWTWKERRKRENEEGKRREGMRDGERDIERYRCTEKKRRCSLLNRKVFCCIVLVNWKYDNR